MIDDLENTATAATTGEQPRGHCGQKGLGKTRAHLCSLRKTKGKKDPAFVLNGSMTCAERKNKSEEETDGPILYEKAEREDVTWESPQNKPSVRCKACVAAGVARQAKYSSSKGCCAWCEAERHFVIAFHLFVTLGSQVV